MTLVALLNLHGIVGLIMKQKIQYVKRSSLIRIQIFSLCQRAVQPIKTSKKIKN